MLFNIFPISGGRRLLSQRIQKDPASDRGQINTDVFVSNEFVTETYALGRLARGGAVGCGTALKDGWSRVRLPIDTMGLESTQPLTKMSTRNISWGVKVAWCRADNFTTFLKSGSLNFLDPSGLSRSGQRFLYLLYPYFGFTRVFLQPINAFSTNQLLP
jgi:hypothetical protein